jgi:ABC-type nickel/cobalt efflux system permease component RcnA
MFRRILIEDWTTIFTLMAFVTVASIYLTMLYRTVRLRRAELDHLSNMPLADDEKAAPDQPSASAPSRHE